MVAGSNNPWTRRRKLKLADLEGEQWLLPTLDTVTGTLIAQAFQASGLDFRPKGVTTGFALLQTNSLVASGDFLAFFPSSLLRVGTLGFLVKKHCRLACPFRDHQNRNHEIEELRAQPSGTTFH